jgi:peptidase M23-like protein
VGTLTRIALVLVLASAPALAQRREPVWPMASGVHDVLHSFQNPFSFAGQYFHEGVDIRRGTDGRVLAMRSGIVRYRNPNDTGGTLRVEVQTEHGLESDSYHHVRLAAWQPGDQIQAGEQVGQVSTSYFWQELQDHVHVNRFRGEVAGNGYVPGRTNMLHPLALFSAPDDRDPAEHAPGPDDANEDGWLFRVVRHGDPDTVLEHASGAVELLVEADDRQSDSLYFAQGLLSIGYWIESLAGGDDVASAEKPYRLVRFDDDWRASSPDCDTLVRLALLTAPQYEVEFGPDDTGWRMLATYRLTRAAGFRGRGDELSPTQAWLTSARKATGAPNGTGGLSARTPEEARFPDGLWRVHVLTEDLVRTVDTTFEVVVDNFAPAVRALRVRPATLAGRVRLEVELSEPMAELTTLALGPELGELSPWRSAEPAGQRRRFEAELRLTARPAALAGARLVLGGHDLAGNALTAELRRPGTARLQPGSSLLGRQ